MTSTPAAPPHIRLISVCVGVLLLIAGLPAQGQAQALDASTVCPSEDTLTATTDGEGGVHAGAIQCLLQLGIVAGQADGSFGADDPLRRDQMASIIAAFLATALGQMPAASPTTFADVSPTNAHASAIGILESLGLSTGVGDGNFDPAGHVTRGQLATFVAKTLDLLDDGQVNGSLTPVDQPAFDDVTGSVHRTSIATLAALRVVQGTTPTSFEPAKTVNRAQTATFFANAAVAALLLGKWAPITDPVPPTLPPPTSPPPTSPPPEENQPPIIEAIGAQDAVEGTEFTLQVSASDPDDDVLSFTASGLPSGLAIDGAGLIAGTPAVGSSADSPYQITVYVSDGTDTSSAIFTLTVAAAEPTVIFRDEFDRDGIGTDWTVTGAWSISGDNNLVSAGTGVAMWNQELTAQMIEDGYYLEARVRKDGTNGIGLVAGRTARNSGTHVFPHLFHESEARLGTLTDGTYNTLSHVSYPNPYNTWFVLRVEMRGDRATMLVDGEQVADASSVGFSPGGWLGLQGIGTGTSFEFDYVEAGTLDPSTEPAVEPTLAPGTLLASEDFNEPDGSPWPAIWDVEVFNDGAPIIVDGRGTIEATGPGNIDMYAVYSATSVNDGYQSLVVHYDGVTRGGASLVFRHAESSVAGAQPDTYRLFWLPRSPNGLWIRHTKDGNKTTLASSSAWDNRPAGDYILEGGIEGDRIKVRIRPVGSSPRAADDWDVEYTHTGPGFLASGDVGIFAYTADGVGTRWQVSDWQLYDLAD